VPIFREAALGKLHGCDVETVDGEDRFGCAEVALPDMNCDFAFLAGEKRNIVVIPKDRQDFWSIFSLEQTEPH
jgi:hypothetical protein